MTRLAHTRGFTLIEVMVAIAIFSVVAAIAYSTFDATDRTARSVQREMADLQAMQRMLQAISNDLYQAQPRPVREPVGTTMRPPILADVRNNYFLELTRTGYANPLGLPRATALRVGYRLDNGELIRAQWPVLDNLLATEPDEVVLMEKIERVQIRYLVPGTEQWTEEWPGGGQNAANRAPPRAIEVIIEHEEWGELRRLLEIAG